MRMKTILMAIMAFLAVTATYAATWRVNPNPKAAAKFLTVAEAMDDYNVKTGDTIMLDPGYHGQIDVTKKGITLIGTGYMLDHNKGWAEAMTTTAGRIFLVGGCKIEGITFESVTAYEDNVTVSRCKAWGIDLSSYNNHTIEQCLVNGYIIVTPYSTAKNNIVLGYINASANGTGSVVENNVVIYRADYNHQTAIQHFRNATIKNNIVICTRTDHDEDGHPWSANTVEFNTEYNNSITNNVFSTPADWANEHYNSNYYIGATVESIFVNEGSDDARYMLRADSPAKGKATHGGDCGAFDGPTPYVLSGIPRFLPHITEALVPTRPTDGKITIKLKIENQDD